MDATHTPLAAKPPTAAIPWAYRVEAWGAAHALTNISIDGDKFVTGTSPLFRGGGIWGSRDYKDLASVRSALGFEFSGTMI